MDPAPAYYRRLDRHRWQPGHYVQGAWNPGEQHMAPVAGLLAQALPDHDPRPDLVLCTERGAPNPVAGARLW